MSTEKSSTEKLVVALVAALQFTSMLDLLVVMPLGPDFALGLGIPASQLGIVGGMYAAAAAISGIAGMFLLDRFDRRPVLLLGIFGLAIGTFACAGATSFATLVAARALAGFFGGPVTSLGTAIIADVVPEARRGRAMAGVVVGYAAANILGVPAGLALAHMGGWRTPFLGVGALAVICGIAALKLPSLKGHIAQAANMPSAKELFRKPAVLLAYVMFMAAALATSTILINAPAFVEYNLGYPRTQLWLLYLVGGLIGIVVVPPAGRLVDKVGSTPVAVAGGLIGVLTNYFGFITATPIPAMPMLIGVMVGSGVRFISLQTLTTKIPEPAERARFMSGQSVIQQVGVAIGAFASSALMTEGEGHKLIGMGSVALLAICATVLLPILVAVIERMLRGREAGATAPASAT